MDTQHQLFDPPPRTRARRTDPDTSQLAAARVREFAGTHQAKILDAMKRIGAPAGAEQIAAYARIDAYQVRKRLPELQAAGLAFPMNVTRDTVTGRRERLWCLNK